MDKSSKPESGPEISLTKQEEALAKAYREAAEEMKNDPLFDLDIGHGLEREEVWEE